MSTLEYSSQLEGHIVYYIFTNTVTQEADVNPEFPAEPWVSMTIALGFFEDVVAAVDDTIREFVAERPLPRTITVKFNRRQPQPPGNGYFRCGNAWFRFEKDVETGTLLIELHRIPGTYREILLLDSLDHVTRRAGHGMHEYVDGRPNSMRQKLEHALQARGFYLFEDRSLEASSIPQEELIRVRGD